MINKNYTCDIYIYIYIYVFYPLASVLTIPVHLVYLVQVLSECWVIAYLLDFIISIQFTSLIQFKTLLRVGVKQNNQLIDKDIKKISSAN